MDIASTMIDLAALLRRLLHLVCGRRMVILGLGVASGLVVVLDPRLFAVGLLRGFCSRHCLSSVGAPIGSGGYATGVEFTAHLSQASGSSQGNGGDSMLTPGQPLS